MDYLKSTEIEKPSQEGDEHNEEKKHELNINNPCDSSHHSRPIPHLFTSFLTYSFHYQGTTHLSED